MTNDKKPLKIYIKKSIDGTHVGKEGDYHGRWFYEKITPSELLELCPEIVEKYRREGFRAAREANLTDVYRESEDGKSALILQKQGRVKKYLTEQDYIDSLNKPVK